MVAFPLSPSQGFGKVFCVEHAIVSVRKISSVKVVFVFEVFLFKSSDKVVSLVKQVQAFGYFSDIYCIAQVAALVRLLVPMTE